MAKEFEALIKIGGGLDPSLQKAIDQAKNTLKGMGDKVGSIGSSLGKGMSKAAEIATGALKAVGTVGVAAIGAVSAAAVKFGTDAVQAAASYEQAFADASTLMTGTQEQLQAVSDDILRVSNETGIAAEDLANSVYSAISAGIAQEDAVEFAGKSARLAAAGFTDVDTALTAVAKTLNAYGLDASHTDEIQKMLIQTQNLGITTVGELGASLAQVTPTAAAFGVSFDQVSAALAGMTAQGTPTAQSTTQLNSLIAELGKDGTVASKNFSKLTEHIQKGGLTFAEAMERGWDLNDVLSLFSEEADKTGKSMVDMFSSIEAGKAALSIYNSDFTSNLEAMGTEADVVGEAYDKVTGTYEHQMELIKNMWQNFKIEAGEAILPYITDLAQTSMPIIKGLMSDIMPVITRIITAVMPVLQSIGQQVLPRISSALQRILPFAEAILTQTSESAGPLLDIVLNLADTIGGALAPIVEGMLPVISGLIAFVSENLPILIGWILQLGEDIFALVAPIGDALFPALEEIFNAIMPSLTMIMDMIIPEILGLLGELTPVISAIFTAAQPIISTIIQALPTVITLIGAVLAALKPVVNFIATALSGAIAGISKSFGAMVNSIKTILENVLSFVENVFTGNWKGAWEDVVGIFGAVFKGLAGMMTAPINAVIGIINRFIEKINTINVTIPEGVPIFGGKTFAPHLAQLDYLAKGGFTEGVSIAGEAGTEAVISFDPQYRQENLSYWARAGKLLGANPNAVDTVATGATNNSQGNYITFSPQVTIQGNADYDTVLEALRDNEAEFMDMVQEFLQRKAALSYG